MKMGIHWITPKIKRQVAKEMAEEPPVIVVDENTFHDNASADNTNQTATTKETTNDDDLHAQLRQRNAGKQKRK